MSTLGHILSADWQLAINDAVLLAIPTTSIVGQMCLGLVNAIDAINDLEFDVRKAFMRVAATQMGAWYYG